MVFYSAGFYHVNRVMFWFATKMQDNYYSQFKFQPKIDQMSRIISAPTNLQELYMVRRFHIFLA